MAACELHSTVHILGHLSFYCNNVIDALCPFWRYLHHWGAPDHCSVWRQLPAVETDLGINQPGLESHHWVKMGYSLSSLKSGDTILLSGRVVGMKWFQGTWKGLGCMTTSLHPSLSRSPCRILPVLTKARQICPEGSLGGRVEWLWGQPGQKPFSSLHTSRQVQAGSLSGRLVQSKGSTDLLRNHILHLKSVWQEVGEEVKERRDAGLLESKRHLLIYSPVVKQSKGIALPQFWWDSSHFTGKQMEAWRGRKFFQSTNIYSEYTLCQELGIFSLLPSWSMPLWGERDK